jgi:hypothetical protein
VHVDEDVGRNAERPEGVEASQVHAGAFEGAPVGQLHEEERETHRGHAGRMDSRDHVGGRKRHGRGGRRRIGLDSEREALGRGDLAAHDAVLAPLDRDLDEAGLLLERHRHRRIERSELARPGQGKGRPDVRVPGEGDLHRRREDAHPAGVAGFGRQHEGALGEVELAGDLLHPRLGKAAGVGQDGQRVAAERAIGEDVADEVPVAHRRHALR